MNIHQISFSPTGGTRRVGELLCKGFDAKCYATELCTKQENLKYPDIKADDMVVVSMPAYTSQTCHVCGQRGNRIERDTFICTNPECTCYNQAQDADMNAAINIAKSKDVVK